MDKERLEKLEKLLIILVRSDKEEFHRVISDYTDIAYIYEPKAVFGYLTNDVTGIIEGDDESEHSDIYWNFREYYYNDDHYRVRSYKNDELLGDAKRDARNPKNPGGRLEIKTFLGEI